MVIFFVLETKKTIVDQKIKLIKHKNILAVINEEQARANRRALMLGKLLGQLNF